MKNYALLREIDKNTFAARAVICSSKHPPGLTVEVTEHDFRKIKDLVYYKSKWLTRDGFRAEKEREERFRIEEENRIRMAADRADRRTRMDVCELISDTALDIEGFISFNELVWLTRAAFARPVIVEVGSWLGRSSKVISGVVGGFMYAVDEWSTPLGDVDSPKMFGSFNKNLKTEIVACKCIPLRMSSTMAVEAVRKVHPDGVDMVFVNSGHRRQETISDIHAWRSLIKPGGILCGHGYKTAFPGVMIAVDEILPDACVQFGGSIWSLTV
jgi:hypothetical protein